MADGSDDKQGNNWTVQEYFCLLRAADAIYNKTPEGKREAALASEETLHEEFDRQSQEMGMQSKRDGKTLHRTLESLKSLHKLIRDKLPHELPLNAPDGFFWRKGTKRLWDCFRDADFRAVCDQVMFKIDTSTTNPTGVGSSDGTGVNVDTGMGVHGGLGGHVGSSHPAAPPPVMLSQQVQQTPVHAGMHQVHHETPKSTPKIQSRYYSSMGGTPHATDPVAVERLTYIIEAQQGNIADMLTKLFAMHQEQLQQQTQQAQQLNASLQALLGESERYFHEVVQINQQLVGQLRDLFAATVQAEANKGGADDEEARAKRRKAEAPAASK